MWDHTERHRYFWLALCGVVDKVFGLFSVCVCVCVCVCVSACVCLHACVYMRMCKDVATDIVDMYVMVLCYSSFPFPSSCHSDWPLRLSTFFCLTRNRVSYVAAWYTLWGPFRTSLPCFLIPWMSSSKSLPWNGRFASILAKSCKGVCGTLQLKTMSREFIALM